MALEPLEVFALTSDMQRATGSIPYTSLMWDRKYYEPGSFLMELPANVYDPSWAYIYTDERPETGIIQKVEYSDTATTAGGVDTVILSGFFMEWELNRYTFLVEQTEEEAYRYYKPSPARKSPPTLYQGNDGNLYQEAYGGGLYDMNGEYVAPATSDKYESLGLTEVELGLGAGATEIMFETNNLEKFPSGYWGSGQYTKSGYAYYTEDGSKLRVVDTSGEGAGTETEYEMVGFGPGTSSQAIYKDEDGNYKWVAGVASKVDGAYERALDSWQNEVKSEGLEVVVGDGTIMGGSTYAIKHRTVKGPWQLRTDLDVNEPADNVQRIIQWAQDIWGNNILYDEPGFEGESKIIDPSLRLFGDLAYEELKTIGASPRLSYSFESDTCVFEIWRGLDRTQSQAGVPAPPTPDEPEPDEPTIDDLYEAVDYIEATGEQWIDTGVFPNQDTKVVMDVQMTSANTAESTNAFFGVRTTASSEAYGVHWNHSTERLYFFYNDGYAYASVTEMPQRVTITMDKNALTFGDVSLTRTYSAFQCSYPLTLCAFNLAGAPDWTLKGRVYSASVYGNGTKIDRQLMPYRRKADGVFGLLDLVNEVFYESASGVPFTGPSYAAGTYEELDYVVSTGEQWLDTGFVANQDTKVSLGFQIPDAEATNNFLGARSTTSSNAFTISTMSGKWRVGYGSSTTITTVAADTGVHEFTLDKNVFSIDGETVHTASSATFECPVTLAIGKINHKSSTYAGYGRCYFCLIYDNGTLVRDYAPRRRVSDGTVGLLDLANDTFYTSAGTEPFLAPGELPSGYTRLEYIESTGSQYIDTGFKPNQNTRVVMGFKIATSASGYRAVFAARDANLERCFALFTTASGVFYPNIGIKTDYANMSSSTPVIGEHVADANKNTVTVDGESYTFTARTFQNTTTLYLFACNENGTMSMPCDLTCSYCQIYDNGTLTRDYVPAKNSNGEAGLFDLITMTFYTDAAGVGFVAGPELVQVAAVAEVSTFALSRTVAASDESNTAANPFAVFSDTWGTLYGFTASKDVSNYRNTCYVLYQFRDQTDADGNPIGPRGFIKARLEDELPDAETYLDLRGEEPEDDQTDEAFIESLRQRGLAHLQANYAAIESLDTGTLTGSGYLTGYDLGDKVDMLVEAIGLVKEARITGVCEVHEAGSSTATLEIGEQKLTNIRKAVIV